MNKARFRFWLLTGLNVAVAVTLLLFAAEKSSATRGLVSDGLLVVLIVLVFLLVPVIGTVLYFLGRRTPGSRTRGQIIYARVSCAFLGLGWLVTVFPALFWSAILLSATEPWPMSLRQGPDTDHARQGYERLFGFAPDASQSSIYFFSFNVRDASYFVRFRYDDVDVIARIARSRDIVEAPITSRNDARFDVRARENHLSWWDPKIINRSARLFVDRPTAEKIAGRRAWNSPIGRSRILWVDADTRTAFYRELEF